MSPSRFCVLTTARSGSTFLCELLDSVPGVICQGELFHKRSIHQARRHRLDLQTSLEERDCDPVGFLHRLEASVFERWPEVVTSGFKLFPTHNATVLRHVVSEADYRIVFLRRTNLLAQFSSNLLAKQAGRWARRDPHPRFEEGVVRFDADGFRAFVAGQNRAFDEATRQLEARNAESVTITFDEIKSEAAIQRVLRHLGVDFGGDLSVLMADVSVIRENRPNIIDRFSNPSDVVSTMRELGTEEWMGPEFASDQSDDGARIAQGDDPQLRPTVSTMFRGASFSTNRWGMRDRDYQKVAPPATRRIAVLGPTFVMGGGVNDGEPFEQVVEDQLNRDLSPRTGLKYELLNFGVPEFSLIQQATLLEGTAVGQFRPDVVLVVGHAASDIRAITRSIQITVARGNDVPDYAKAQVAEAGVLPNMPRADIQQRLKRVSGDLVRGTLCHLAAAIRHMGAQPVFAIIPVPQDPPDLPGRLLLHSAALDAGFAVIDIQHCFQGHEVSQLTLDGVDHHPNAEGHRVIAAALCAALPQQAGLLEAPDKKALAAMERTHTAWAAGVVGRKAKEEWRKMWRVETHHNSVATLEHSAPEPGQMRVVIAETSQLVGWHVKLRYAPVSIQEGERYLLTFRVRADAARLVVCGVEQDVEPWRSLGLYRELDVTTEWQTFECPFTATGTEAHARIFCDLGSSNVLVDVADVRLRNLSTSRDLMASAPGAAMSGPA